MYIVKRMAQCGQIEANDDAHLLACLLQTDCFFVLITISTLCNLIIILSRTQQREAINQVLVGV